MGPAVGDIQRPRFPGHSAHVDSRFECYRGNLHCYGVAGVYGSAYDVRNCIRCASDQNSKDSLCRMRVAARASLARPSTLVLIAGVAGVLGFWLARCSRAAPLASSVPAATASPVGLLLRGLLVRYGMQFLPVFLHQVQAAWQKRAD